MRRIIVLVAGLGILPAAAGCHHTAGFCDCQPPVNPCCQYGLYPPDLHGALPSADHEPPVKTVKERLDQPREGL